MQPSCYCSALCLLRSPPLYICPQAAPIMSQNPPNCLLISMCITQAQQRCGHNLA
jgi:hypothetical protein